MNRETVIWIGHVLTTTGIKPDPKKVEAINTTSEPKDKAAVLRLLGMASYLARYVPQFSEVCTPLRQLLGRENEFRWGDNTHGQAFEN